MVLETDTTYTAVYRVCSICGPALAASYSVSTPITWNAGDTRTYMVTVTNTGAQTWNAAGAQIVRLGIHFGTGSDWPHDGWATD